MRTRISTAQAGFTLIEMSMVLAIIGFVIGGGLMSMNAWLERSRMMTTRQNMDQIESALTLFAIRNNRLPCPASGAAGTTGEEQPNTATGICTVNGTVNRVVPWVTLGLDEAITFDGWGRRFTYMPAHTNIAGIVDGVTEPNTLQRGAAPGYAFPSGTYLRIERADGGDIAPVTPAGTGAGAAYVLISHGRNGQGGYLRSGNVAAGAAGDELTNTSVGATYVQNPETGGFDDIVRWRTPHFIIQQCGTGACGNP